MIEEEWSNIESIIRALSLKEITQSILVKKLCNYSASNRTRKAIFEYDKLIRSIYTLKYLQDKKLQKIVHHSQNRVEFNSPWLATGTLPMGFPKGRSGSSPLWFHTGFIPRVEYTIDSYHQLRAAIATAYGKKQLWGRGERELAISNECGRFIANAIIHYNSSILSKLKEKYTAEGNEKALAILKKISPSAWRHIHFQGHFIFSDDKIIDLDVIIGKVFLDELRKNVKQSDAKRA